MNQWRPAWFGSAQVSLGTMDGRRIHAGRHEMMISHHSSAILMADEVLKISGRPQIHNLAHIMIDSQAKEIGEMRAIYSRSFGKL